MPKITYKDNQGNSKTIEVENGLTVMEGAIQNDIPGIDADCGGSMACATCHVYVEEKWLDKIPKAEEAEVDMIDMAFEPKKNSRLSCQLIVSDELDGLSNNTRKTILMKKTDVIIIGAGPVGLFAVHQLGIKGLKAVVIDNLDKAGGQCIELYPDKPIYDIPAVPECTGEELTKNLLEQIKPFNTEFFYNERVDEVKQDKDNWIVKTNNNNEFTAPNIIIAGGVGSFEPRKLSLKDTEKYEGNHYFIL